jgi:hypothetical protein
MTSELELVAESNIAGYSMQMIAHDFGPGEYFLNLSADPQKLWGLKNCKVIIAPEYASSNGFQVYPVQRQPEPAMSRVSEANALQATASALQGDKPVTIRDLAGLVEMVADRTAEAITRRSQQAPPMTGDPMQFFGAVLQMQTTMEDRAVRMAERLSGLKVPEPEEKEDSFAGGLMKLVPAILQAFAPKPAAPTQNIQPAATIQEAPSIPPMANPNTANLEREVVQVPMTQVEIDQFGTAIAMFQPYLPHVISRIGGEGDLTPVAEELVDYIPPKIEEQLINLDKLVTERGQLCLAILSPDLATHRGADLIHKIALILSQPAE